jgi:hypothetical protein
VDDPPILHTRIDSIFQSGGLMRSTNSREPAESCRKFYTDHILCTDQEKLRIFETTIGQAANKSWYTARKFRVSASKARQRAFARKDDTLFKYFFGSVADSDNLRYGRDTEPIAREEYASVQSEAVVESGLVISRHFPWLCGSPNGLAIGEDGELTVLEIKCPVSGQNGKIDISYVKNNMLSRTHAYFAQVQIQLFVCDAKTRKHRIFTFMEARTASS